MFEFVYFMERVIDLIDEVFVKWLIRLRDEVVLKDGFGVLIIEVLCGVFVYVFKVENGRVSYVDIIILMVFNFVMME